MGGSGQSDREFVTVTVRDEVRSTFSDISNDMCVHRIACMDTSPIDITQTMTEYLPTTIAAGSDWSATSTHLPTTKKNIPWRISTTPPIIFIIPLCTRKVMAEEERAIAVP